MTRRTIALAAWRLVAGAFIACFLSWPVAAAERSGVSPAAMDFSGPRMTWQRLGEAVRRGDKDGALKLLTPAAQERDQKTINEWLKTKPFDEKRFGKVRAVTLSAGRFATVSITRVKDGGTYSADVMMMRGDDGRWRIDRLPPA